MSVCCRFSPPSRFAQFYALTKPRRPIDCVLCLDRHGAGCAGLAQWAQVGRMALASLGIWLVAGAAAAFNCIVERA